MHQRESKLNIAILFLDIYEGAEAIGNAIIVPISFWVIKSSYTSWFNITHATFLYTQTSDMPVQVV